MRRVFLAFLFLASLALSGAGEELQVASSVSKKSLRAGESVVLTLRLQGPGSAIPQPPLPPLPDLGVTGQYQTVETEGGQRVYAYHYMLAPKRAGRIEVPELSLRIGGATRTVAGFALEVEAAPAVTPSTPAENPSAQSAAQDELYLMGELSASRAFLGQPVTYTLHLITRNSVRNFDVAKHPSFQGFRKVEVPKPPRPLSRTITRDGKRFLDVTILKFTLFPIEEGTLRIEPFEAVLRVESKEVVGRVATVKLSGGGATLTTESLPPPPPGFTGAVGSFTLAFVHAAPVTASLGQPLDLDYRLEGTGFLPDQPLHWEETPFFSAYPATSQDQSAFESGTFRVRRSLRLSLQPKMAGDALLPKASLVFFDPASRRYERLEVGGSRVEVNGGRGSQQHELSLAPLIPEPRASLRPAVARPGAGFVGLLFAPFAVSLLLASGLWLYRTRFAAPEKIRARALAHQAHRHLHGARRHLDVRQSQVFHGELLKALQAGLELRTGRPCGGLTHGQVREALKECGESEGEVSRISSLLDQMETAEFAGETVSKRDLQARLDEVKRYVREASRG